MLDFGCGPGYLAAAGAQYFDSVYAIDWNTHTINSLLPHFFDNAKIRVFDELIKVRKKVNVVYAWHFLEHLINIKESVDKLKDYLLPDGLIFFQVPMFRLDSSRIIDEHFTFLCEKSVKVLCLLTDMNLVGTWRDVVNDFLSCIIRGRNN